MREFLIYSAHTQIGRCGLHRERVDSRIQWRSYIKYSVGRLVQYPSGVMLSKFVDNIGDFKRNITV